MGHAESLGSITVDGLFDDWATVGSYTDPSIGQLHDGIPDVHDTDHSRLSDTPRAINHPDVDILEYKFTHDEDSLYAYFRSTGVIGNTQRASEGKAGRYYVIVTIDVDNDNNTGYFLHEGGYYPTSSVDTYDMNMEIEYYDGAFNTGHYLSHDALDSAGLTQDFIDLTSGEYPANQPGPYTPGFVEQAPGNYKKYTQWVYQESNPADENDDQLILVVDKGPVVPGIVSVALSEDGHQLEMKAPFKGFMKDSEGNPNMLLGKMLDISFSLEASGELALAPDVGEWASDTADPIVGYTLGTSGPSADFDLDGDIDGVDFIAWQRGFGTGTTLQAGDANDDRRVGGSDQVVWRQQFGQSVIPAALAVPEPTSMRLALAVLFAVSVGGETLNRARHGGKK